MGISHPKLTEVIHTDFSDCSSISEYFKNTDICYYCIGVYTGSVPTEVFKNITVSYTRNIAETLKRESVQATFCFLSGQGADQTEKSSILFAKQKGIAENILIKLKFNQLYIFRPGYIYPSSTRKEPNMIYRIMKVIYKPLSFIYPNIGISSTDLAGVIFTTGINKGRLVVYENRN